MNRRKKKARKDKEEYIDIPLLSSLQSQGGITFKEPSYIITGSGYVKVIHIYRLPGMLFDFWMDKVFSIEGTIATVDIATRDKNEVKKNLNKSIKEEYARVRTAKDFEEMYDAQRRQERLQYMYDEIQSMGESIKMVHFRIFVPGRSLAAAEERAGKIMNDLEADQFMPTILLNEGKREYQSLFIPYEEQHKEPFYIKGHSMMTEQLAGGYPFHYSSLEDPRGTVLGFTPCGGPVIFDVFEKTQTRKHYNGVIVGEPGSGKSTTLKKLFEVRAAEGDFIRCFDVSGEFSALTREFGGRIIRCDGTTGMLNPFEILRAGDDEFTSFAKHIAKIAAMYRCLQPSLPDTVITDLENLLKEFYAERGLTPDDGGTITGLSASRYPTFSDFGDFLIGRMKKLASEKPKSSVEEKLFEKRMLNIEDLSKVTKRVIGNYGKMLDGHTSITNIVDEKIVTFDISNIKDLGSVFVAIIFNMLSLCWDNGIANGTIMKRLWEEGKITDDEIVKFMIIVDESHRWVNTTLPDILRQLITYLREARKYIVSIFLASQSIRDYVPEGTGSENLDLIKTIFELTQYKFMFRQDSAAMPLIQSIFSGVLTFSQMQSIPRLGIGQTILSISGDMNIDFDVWVSKDYELPLHQGGR